MAALNGLVLLSTLCLVYMTKSLMSMQCQLPQNWDEERLGPNPVTTRRGSVVLVAMFHGYCGYCQEQARGLYKLKNELADEGYPQIEMVIINGGGNRSRTNIDNLINATSIPVIQDTEDHVIYRRVFLAGKDDFLVYDRCGQHSFYIPHPWSNLNYTITSYVLKRVHRGQHGCRCSLDRMEAGRNGQ